MNKYAAEKIAQEYYNYGIKLAFQQAGIKTALPEAIMRDMPLQRVSKPEKKKKRDSPSAQKPELSERERIEKMVRRRRAARKTYMDPDNRIGSAAYGPVSRAMFRKHDLSVAPFKEDEFKPSDLMNKYGPIGGSLRGAGLMTDPNVSFHEALQGGGDSYKAFKLPTFNKNKTPLRDTE